MKILVLEGGDSSEREVSFRSAKSVAKALTDGDHKVFKYDPKNGFAGLKEVCWQSRCRISYYAR